MRSDCLVDRCRVSVVAHIPALLTGHSGPETCAELWRSVMAVRYDIPAHRPEHFSVRDYPCHQFWIRHTGFAPM